MSNIIFVDPTTRKYSIKQIKGLSIFPRNIPKLIHNLFGILNTFGNIMEINKLMIDAYINIDTWYPKKYIPNENRIIDNNKPKPRSDDNNFLI